MTSNAVKLLQEALAASKRGSTPASNAVKQLTNEQIAEQLQTTEIQAISSKKDQIQEETDEEILKGNIKTSLASIVANFSDKELVSKDVRYVLGILQSYPVLKEILQPQDIGIMVKGLQQCYGSQVKRAESTASKTRKKASDVADVSSILDGLGIQ